MLYRGKNAFAPLLLVHHRSNVLHSLLTNKYLATNEILFGDINIAWIIGSYVIELIDNGICSVIHDGCST